MNLRTMWSRPENRFLIVFVACLATSFFVIALNPVNDAVVVPFTGFVATMSGALIGLVEPDFTVAGVVLRSPRFAVTIYNGCNGLITSLIFISGVLAFPARLGAKIIGLVGGLVAIQIINLVRIISLFYIGVYLPQFFGEAHTFIWQSLVILAGVALWIVWAHRASAHAGPRGADR